jgi:hypothetical protein
MSAAGLAAVRQYNGLLLQNLLADKALGRLLEEVSQAPLNPFACSYFGW